LTLQPAGKFTSVLAELLDLAELLALAERPAAKLAYAVVWPAMRKSILAVSWQADLRKNRKRRPDLVIFCAGDMPALSVWLVRYG